MSFPSSKASITLQFQDEKYQRQFPWTLLARQDLLRRFVQNLNLERTGNQKGLIEYKIDLAEEDVDAWFTSVVNRNVESSSQSFPESNASEAA